MRKCSVLAGSLAPFEWPRKLGLFDLRGSLLDCARGDDLHGGRLRSVRLEQESQMRSA